MKTFSKEEATNSNTYSSSVTLVVIGQDLNPADVSSILELSPNQSWKKGDKKVFRSGREHVYEWGGWKLFQKANTEDASLERQLEWWVETLSHKSTQIQKLKETGHIAILDCYLSINETATVQLNPDLLGSMSAMGLSIELNCFVDNEEKEAADE